ncbi:hypothetical protein [Burkholderia stabilis]|uniref:hypothetical protein n=1 Tax=Burkholderia stabilis TaxID=95485 RepID=UPI001F4AB2CE|nr:hypothetical protein [Burkholderia stabilis]
MEIALHGGGKVLMAAPQQQWHGDSPEIAQYSRFAGQDMTAITDDAGAFDLLYLGYKTGGFSTIEAAKAAAPEFARRVLAHMSSLIDG